MIDNALVQAVEDAVKDAGQPQNVARRLTAWLTQMSEGELSRDENAIFLLEACNELLLED